MKININNTPENRAQIAWDLFQIHTHMPEADLLGVDKKTMKKLEKELPAPGIVYREADLIKLFEKWGLPKPDWDSPEYRKLWEKEMESDESSHESD